MLPLDQVRRSTTDVAIAAGGGSSCQFGYHVPEVLHSLEMKLYPQTEAVRERGRAAIEDARRSFVAVLSESRSKPASEEGSLMGLPLSSSNTLWIGLASHADFAKNLGIHERILPAKELLTSIDYFIDELLDKQGEEPHAVAKWGDRAKKNWPIAVAQGIRLRCIVEELGEDCNWYFAAELPNEGRPPPSGQQWRKCYGMRPRNGVELVNPALSQALQDEQLEFTPAELSAFGVKGLTAAHFVEADGQYFQPGSVVPLDWATGYFALKYPTARVNSD